MSLASAELRQLVALDAVLRLRSFTRAAEDLGYTQSAVSQQIKNLERLVGATLVERGSGRNSVIPTDAGLRLQRHTQRVIASLQAAEADLAALAQGSDQLLLKVGTFQSVGATILPPLLTKLRDLAPEIEVELIEAVSTRELLEELANGQLDLSFALLPLERRPFEAATLMLDPFVLLVSSDSPIANHAQPATREELADLPLVGYRHPGTAPHAETRLLALGITPRIVFRTDELATVHGLVASGLAAAVLPCLAVNLQHDGVRTVDLHSLLPPRTVGLAWHADRDRSSAALIFQAQATRVCREITHVRAAAMHPLRGPTAE